MTKSLTKLWGKNQEETTYQKIGIKMTLNHQKNILAHSY